MNLIVEDGSNVPGANTYASADDLYSYAVERGLPIENSSVVLEQNLLKAMDYLYSFNDRMIGYSSFSDQTLPFPRSIQVGYSLNDLGIPNDIKVAQMVAAIAASQFDLSPYSSGVDQQAIRQTVGPITVEYAAGKTSLRPRIPQVEALLARFLVRSFGQPEVIRG